MGHCQKTRKNFGSRYFFFNETDSHVCAKVCEGLNFFVKLQKIAKMLLIFEELLFPQKMTNDWGCWAWLGSVTMEEGIQFYSGDFNFIHYVARRNFCYLLFLKPGKNASLHHFTVVIRFNPIPSSIFSPYVRQRG